MVIILLIAILIMSAAVHELSHGLAANSLGDPTARYAGRLTLNPLKHLDPVGSFLVPLVLIIFTGFAFGWAKPVPYNPYNLRNQQWGPAMVGLAGPLSNILLALIFGFALRWGGLLEQVGLLQNIGQVFGFIVFINVLLAVFNLIPIPPLDGSKLVYAVLPYNYLRLYEQLEVYGFFFVILVVILVGPYVIGIPVNFLFKVITGYPVGIFL